jgi:hypothetical protein
MTQHKHLVQKARLTEEKRRAEAKEAGIVLEREQWVAKKAPEERERGSVVRVSASLRVVR